MKKSNLHRFFGFLVIVSSIVSACAGAEGQSARSVEFRAGGGISTNEATGESQLNCVWETTSAMNDEDVTLLLRDGTQIPMPRYVSPISGETTNVRQVAMSNVPISSESNEHNEGDDPSKLCIDAVVSALLTASGDGWLLGVCNPVEGTRNAGMCK